MHCICRNLRPSTCECDVALNSVSYDKTGMLNCSLCGPERFMLEKQADLEALGVQPKRIHRELFGTSHES